MLMKNRDKCLSAKPDFIYDEACLDILTDRNVDIYAQYIECRNCTFEKWASVPGPSNTTSLLVNTKYQLQFKAILDENTTCTRTLRFDEHARYGWNITNGNCSQFYVKEAADNAYLPILGAAILFFVFGTIWYMVKCIYRCSRNRGRFLFPRQQTSQETNDPSGTIDSAPLVVEHTPTKKKHPNRIKSLDVFRGLSIILMIFVNYGGGQYWFFKHSIWNGLTIADLVFPWFAWIMGMSLNISLRSRLRTAMPRKQLALQIFYRSMILIFLGIIINSHARKTDLDDLRLPGVLQRLGVTYLVVGLLETIFAKRDHVETYGVFARRFEDIVIAWPQWLIVMMFVTIHCCVTFLIRVPGCPTGFLGPGGLQFNKTYENCTGGAAGYIDRAIFGNHMYKNPSCHIMYETKAYYDPEGILGTLTSILTVYLGVQAGRIFNTYKNHYDRIYRWSVWAVVTGLIAGGLCNFSKEGGVIPMNKNLWSLSYALGLSSMSFLIETILYILVDVTHKWGGRPFFYPGMNAILLYVGHSITKNTFPFAWMPSYRNHREYLIMNLWGTALWVIIAITLYKKNIFFKI